MTYQTTQPVEDFRKDTKTTPFVEFVHMARDGWLDVKPPYQRDDVWTYPQRIGLIRSLLSGIPVPAIITNDRTSPWWAGEKPNVEAGRALIAVIDGKQRIETMRQWFAGELPVPASWFPAEEIEATEDTRDGAYVRFTGLTPRMQRGTKFTWTVPCTEAKVTSIAEEAGIFMLVNGAGTPQTDADMTRARAVAEGK